MLGLHGVTTISAPIRHMPTVIHGLHVPMMLNDRDLVPMSRAHRPGRTFYSFPDTHPWEMPLWDMLLWARNPLWSRAPLFLSEAQRWDVATPLAPVPRETVAQFCAEYLNRVYDQAMARALEEAAASGRMTVIPADAAIDDVSAADDEHDALVAELVALAKANRREDFDFLAGAHGVQGRDGLWTGTRARLGRSA